MDFSSLPTQGLSSQTDPTRLHAELWADYMSKVMTTWLPMLMATVLVGRDLLGSGTKCFPMDLTGTQPDTNGTTADNTSYAPQPVLNEISDYSRQLAEYVDIYCAKQDHYKSSIMFNYQLFTMMLVIQAGVFYVPTLLWSIKPARKILCHLRFLMHDIGLLYQDLKKDDASSTDSNSTDSNKQSELRYNIGVWQKSRMLYVQYIVKHVITAGISIAFITVYNTVPSLEASNIHDDFLCSVNKKFIVDCAVPSAMVNSCVWLVNLILLCLNISSIVLHLLSLMYDQFCVSRQPFRELGIETPQAESKRHSLKDSHLIYMFLRANIDSIEKYNYVRHLRDVDNIPGTTTNLAHQALSLIHALCCSQCCDKGTTNTSGAAANPINIAGAAPDPTNTAGAAPDPTNTAGAAPDPTNTSDLGAAPDPTNTSDSGAAPNPTNTSDSGAAPDPTNTSDSGAAPDPTNTSDSGAAPNPTNTSGAALRLESIV